jgi:16S rRNA (cytosine967-C5)-methyltransferase
MTDVRQQAVAVLVGILADGSKADALLERAASNLADARDRGLLRELVYGVLRRYFSLEADASRYIQAKPDDYVRLALLVGAYQIRHLRLPVHAAVHATVEAVKHSRHARAAGFVNAVLRRVAESDPPAKLKPHQRVELPQWLFADWRDGFGAERVAEIAEVFRSVPPLSVAVLDGDRDGWIAAVHALGIEATAGELAKQAVLLPAYIDVTALPGYSEGRFTVMDQAAQYAALALEVRAGDKVLDLCAAPGGKTALLARVHPGTEITAVELSAARIPRLEENLKRLQAGNVSVQRGDATALAFADGSFDAILLDAPCSASGVIRRHPDAKFIHDKASVARHAELQKRMVAEALRVLKSGGRLIYAVCSIHPAENEQVVEGLAELQSTERLFPTDSHDGFFIAHLTKR